MENTTILMTIALGLSATLIFGGGILLSKAIRSDKVQEKDEKKDNSSALLITAALMISAGLMFGGGVIISHAVRSDDVQGSEPEILEDTPTNIQEDITVNETTSVTSTTTTTTTTTESTVVETTTEPPTEPETEPELLPINEVYLTDKPECYYDNGFICTLYSDNTLAISGIELVFEDYYDEYSYDALYGSHETVNISKQVQVMGETFTVRALAIGLMHGFDDPGLTEYYWRGWEGVTTIIVPEDMMFVYAVDENEFFNEEEGFWDTQIIYETLTFDEAASIFAEHGITVMRDE